MPRWFTTSRKSSTSHPFFGDLELSGGVWSGEFEFEPIKRRIYVFIEDRNGKPAEGASETVREFAKRYQSLRPAFSVELRELLEPWHKEFWEKTKPLPAGEDLFGLFNLEAINIVANGIDTVDFVLEQGWDDASFRVSLEHWTPKGIGVDD